MHNASSIRACLSIAKVLLFSSQFWSLPSLSMFSCCCCRRSHCFIMTLQFELIQLLYLFGVSPFLFLSLSLSFSLTLCALHIYVNIYALLSISYHLHVCEAKHCHRIESEWMLLTHSLASFGLDFRSMWWINPKKAYCKCDPICTNYAMTSLIPTSPVIAYAVPNVM